ncbi:tail assembly chaperone [Mycobacterium phage ScoobyDoobyDoo]|nr:tail assembly chaperone [Mycobacterium phage ScoobyDoobyDoo]
MTIPSEDFPVDTSIDPDLQPPQRLATAERHEEPIEQTRRIVGELIEEVDDGPKEPEVTLTAEERRDLETLVTVGRRYKTIKVFDHDVRIRTLKTGDEINIGVYTKPYLESHAFARAHQIAVVASGIVEITKDGVEQPLWSSLKQITDPEEIFNRNAEALLQFHPPAVVKIYDGIMELEREFADLAVKLGKL